VSLIQAELHLSPDAGFFDDVPAAKLSKVPPMSPHADSKEVHELQKGNTPSSNSPQADHSQLPKRPSVLLNLADAVNHAADKKVAGSMASSEAESAGLAPLQGMIKQATPLQEQDDDPRPTGFGTQVSSSAAAASPLQGAKERGRPGLWRLLSLARLGARSALSSAMPEWHNTPDADARTSAIVETAEVDRSDISAPGAASLLSRG